jgi:hypothetical protein
MLKIKKAAENISSLFILLVITTLVALTLETVTYKGIFQNHFYLNSNHLYAATFTAGLFIAVSGTKLRKLLNANRVFNVVYLFSFAAIPATIFYTLLSYLEGVNYPNYVYSTFNINLEGFVYLLFFSLSLFLFSSYIKGKARIVYTTAIVLPLVVVLVSFVSFHSWDGFWLLTEEDHLFENKQFLFFAVGGWVAIRTAFALTKRDKSIFIMLGILLILIALEEISWGQRLLGLQAPEILAEKNYKNEINFHNLEYISESKTHLAYITIGIWGSFSGIAINFFGKRSKNTILKYVPDKKLFFLFFLPLTYYLYYSFINDPAIREFVNPLLKTWRWQEIMETFIAAGLMVFVWINYKNVAKEKLK